jgi:glycine/D-amino acid oxidase-like deaminating enzyme
LTRAGRDVVLVDRHAPQHASTAASTALLQWEIDAPLLELEARLGFAKAARIYKRSHLAVAMIARLVHALRIECDFGLRDTLYLAGNQLDGRALREEERLRRLANLPSTWRDRESLRAESGFEREAALRSGGSAEGDPMRLARGLLEAARARTRDGAGARIAAPALAVSYDADSRGVSVATEAGLLVEAEALILATGYEMPAFIPADVHRVVSTFAVATKVQPPQALWPDRALVWEASDPYCYLRTDRGGRIVMGGEDEPIAEAEARDALLDAKAKVLAEKLVHFVPGANPDILTAWCGFFSETADGLPLIGRVPGMPRSFAAFGYGGNGITFGLMAAIILERLMRGERDPEEETFAIDR